MAVVFRPLCAAAVPLKGDALRLGNQLMLSGGVSRYALRDGFILKAVRAGPNVIVTAIEPGGIWAFTNNNLVGFAYGQTVYGFRPVVTPNDASALTGTPVVLLNPDASIPVDSPIRFPDLTTGHTRLSTSGNYTQVLSYGQTAYESEYLNQARYLVPSGSPSLPAMTFSTVVRLDVIVQPSGLPGVTLTGTPEPNVTSARMLRSCAIDEGVMASDTAGAGSRFLPRHVRFKNRFYASYASTALVVNPETGLYEDHVLITPVAQQSVLPPFYLETDPTPPDAAEIATQYGLFVARYRGDSEFPVDDPPPHPLQVVWARRLMLSANPEPTLRPLGTAAAFRHAYTYAVGMQYVPNDLAPLVANTAVITVAIAEYDDDPSLKIGYGVQRNTFDSVTGAVVTTTLYLAELTTDPSAYAYVLYNRLATDDTEYAVAVRVEVDSIVAPTYTHGSLVAGTWQMQLIGATGIVTFDLAAHGLQPFSTRLRGEYAFHPTQVTAVSAHYINRVADYIGANRVACIVCDATQAQSASRVDWKLAVFNATTGALIEVRATFGSTFVGPLTVAAVVPRILVGMSVVSREVVDEFDVVLRPAVLTAFVMEDVPPDGFPVRSTYLSRDGGATWTHVFEGMDGEVYYMGSAANPVIISDILPV